MSRLWNRVHVLLLAMVLALPPGAALALETPVLVSSIYKNNALSNAKQIIRTSTGRLYYFSGNGSHTTLSDGWVDIHTSVNGSSWTRVGSVDQYLTSSDIAVAIDSRNVIHMVTYDWNGHPYYQKFNSSDSPKADQSIEGVELLDSGNMALVRVCSLAIDANDTPHVIYELIETYKGKDHVTLTYANRVGGVWNRIPLWPKTSTSILSGPVSIAIGPDNSPYVLMAGQMLKGNGNLPTAFESMPLGGGSSFVIHQNGDVRVALPVNGNYANYLHDHAQPWTSGWSLTDSLTPDQGGILVLAEEVPYLVTLEADGLKTRKWFEPALLVAAAPSGYTWTTLTGRWSFFNHHQPWLIDIGTRTWLTGSGNYYWYTRRATRTVAEFSAGQTYGLAPLTVQFDNSSRAVDGEFIVSSEWDFDNNGAADSVTTNPAYRYDLPGKYAVRLKVTDSAGGTDSKTLPDYIVVDTDSDGDQVPDSRDTCPQVYNPAQNDVNGDGVGDACSERSDLLAGAGSLTGLKSAKAADTPAADVTALLKDGRFDRTVRVEKLKRGFNALFIRSTAEANKIFSATLRLYVTAAAATGQQILIYPYASDGSTLVTTPVATVNLTTGWNTIDVTSIAHAMNGFGFVKLRLVAASGWAEIAEAAFEAVPYSEWSAAISATALDFGTLEIGADAFRTLTVTNNGSGFLAVGTGAAPAPPFAVTGDGCSGKSLASGQSCEIGIRFNPEAAGSYGGTISVSTNDPAHAVTTVSLSGNATPAAGISGTVTDQATGLPLPGVALTLNLSDIQSADPADLVFSCTPSSALDTSKLRVNDGLKTVCGGSGSNSSITLKARNPFGTDPFIVTWNGISSLAGSTPEYLAQSFKPATSGKLTRASLFLEGVYETVGGYVHVLLKSRLGGDRGSYLAVSNWVGVKTAVGVSKWVDFDFPTPVDVAAGQEYFLEINGTFFNWIGLSGYLFDLSLRNAASYADGTGYARYNGIWTQSSLPLAFRTYIDGQADAAAQESTASIRMYGGNTAELSGYVAVPNGDSPAPIPLIWDSLTRDNDGEDGLNGDDLTATGTFSDTPARYYDANGWVQATMYGYAPISSALATDQFTISFTRTLTAVTDAAGAFSFPGLPQGAYTLSFSKTAYATATATGQVAAGQDLRIDKLLALAPPATLGGAVLNASLGTPLAGAVITLTDSVNIKTAVTDSSGHYLIEGIVPGTYSVSVSADGYTANAASGTLTPAQAGRMDVNLYPASITVTVTSPAPISTAYTSEVTISGRAENAQRVIVSDNWGMVGSPVPVVNGEFSTTVPLDSGDNYLYVSGENDLGAASTTVDLYVTLPAFTLHNLGDSGSVTVMEYADRYNYATWNEASPAIAQEYLRTHSDSYDFLVYLTTFDHPMPSGHPNAYYQSIKNDVQGVGQPVFDGGKWYGSSGALQGIIDMANIGLLAAAPSGAKLDEKVAILNHELMHRFGAYVRFKNSDGTLNSALLGKDNAHWSYLLDSKGSLMYGSGWQDNRNGSYTATSAMSGFSPLDLYLMGMIDKSRVPPMTLIENAGVDKNQIPQLGATVTGTARTVTIADIIAAEGERLPNAATSQKQFKVGFVLLVKPGENPATAVAAVETLRSAWAGKFAELTHGKGRIADVAPSLIVQVDSPLDGATITGPDVTVTGTVINTTGAETGVTVNGMPATISGSRFVANHVPLQEGANTLSVSAVDAGGLISTATRSVTAQAGHYLRISSNIESGTGPLEVSLRINGSFSATAYARSVSGPVPVTVIAGSSPEEFSAKLTAEGTYTFTVSATGPDGNSYADSVTVTVVSRSQLEALLQGKWEAVRAAITNNNYDVALSHFVPGVKEKFRAIFNDPDIDIVTRLAEITRVEFWGAKGRTGKLWAVKQESGEEIAYLIKFVLDWNGNWKILGF